MAYDLETIGTLMARCDELEARLDGLEGKVGKLAAAPAPIVEPAGLEPKAAGASASGTLNTLGPSPVTAVPVPDVKPA